MSKLIWMLVVTALLLTGCQAEPAPSPTALQPNTPSTAPLDPTETERPTTTQPNPTQPQVSIATTAAPASITPVPTTAAPASATPVPTTALPAQPTSPPASPTSAQPIATEPTTPVTDGGSGFIIDHTSLELFDRIPDEYLERARMLRVVYYNASVGENINQGLDCLASPSWGQSPAHCRNDYSGPNWAWQLFTGDMASAPSQIQFPADSTRYDRSRWDFVAHPGDWQSVTRDFITQQVPDNVDKYDVLSYKITYLMVEDRSDILDPQRGYFVQQADRYDIQDMEAMIAAYPDKTFFFWTSSLSRSIGTQMSEDFNNQMRAYASEHNLILYDIADIESHTGTGAPCFDNRDGVKYCTANNKCEEHPDDSLNLAAICQDYTTEIEGGHLGSVSAGKIRLAKAFWVMLARIAGWQP